MKLMLTLFLFIFVLPCLGLSQPALQEGAIEVFGHVEGFENPQKLDFNEVMRLQTLTHETIPTWLALVSDLDTSEPKLHVIDTEYFKELPTKYGIHQAYAQEMGIVSSAQDFISQLKADGRTRKIMPFTMYRPANGLNNHGVQADWVLQNRRYIFKDDSLGFTKTLIQSEGIIQQKLGQIFSGKPFFVTYELADSHRRPNRLTQKGQRDIDILESQGYQVVTEDEMATLAGQAPKPVSLLNGNENNEAYGYIKIVNTNEDMESLTIQHIAVFPTLPDRVPPVAAIVTLENQIELSHINVLAINRGTLNIAVSSKAKDVIASLQSEAKKLDGKPAQIKFQDESLVVQASELPHIVEFQKKLKQNVGVVEIPEIIVNGNLGIRKPVNSDSPATIGAKAANYGRLERLLGVTKVKPGFAIGFDLYREVVTSGGEQSIETRLIFPLIEKVKLGQISPQGVNVELEKIRNAISQVKIPLTTLQSLESLAVKEYSYLGDEEKIRFRSSTNCEDLPRFNGAGLYLSEGIKIKHLRKAFSVSNSMDKIHEDLLLVVGSLWLPQAFWEREYFSIDHKKAGMALQINPSFSNEVANGVIIASLKEGKTDFWINSQNGEASVTNPLPGEISESIKVLVNTDEVYNLGESSVGEAVKVHSHSNLGSVFVDLEGKVSAGKGELLLELLSTTQTVLNELIEDSSQFGIDIEFKLMSEEGVLKLYLKQARPINLKLKH